MSTHTRLAGARFLPAIATLAAAALSASAAPADDAGAEALAIFQRRCVECHGPTKQNGKLRLDSVDAVFKGGKSGPPITAGKSAESLLFERISLEGSNKRMPPRGEALDAGEIAVIRRWIDAGARAPASAAPANRREAADLARPEANALPADYAPTFCVAGDPGRSRFAVGRGTLVAVYELEDPAGRPRRRALLEDHSDLVRAVCFSPDSALVASGDFNQVRVWDAETGALKAVVGPHADAVLALVFSPDSRRLAAGGGVATESGEVKVWQLETGTAAWSATPHTDAVYGLSWPKSAPHIVTAAADRVTYLLDPAGGSTLRRLEAHTHHVLSVSVSADGKRAATAGADRRIKLWDLEKGENIRTLRGHDKAVTWIGIYGDGGKLASAGADGQVRLWTFENESERFSFNDGKGCLQGGAFFGGDKWLVAAEQSGSVRIYDVEKRKLAAALEVDVR